MKHILSLLLTFTFLAFAVAQDIPERPNPPRLVNDMANVLSVEQQQRMENKLASFSRQTSTQIAVVTVSSLNGDDISDFAFRLGEKWGVGQKDKNNGIVVLFKPKTQNERGQIFVAVGYGLEGVIPDAVANRDVINHEMIPRFKQGDVYGGLDAGLNVLMNLAAGEFTAAQYHNKVKQSGKSGGSSIVLIVIIIAIISLLRGRRRSYYSSGSSLPFWVAMGMMGSGRRSHSGTFGDFSSGSGGFGGGFGGFGGGSFGGGGAGGSW